MRRPNGDVVEDNKDMVDVFADFYTELYATRRDSYLDRRRGSMASEYVRDAGTSEIEKQLPKMAKRKLVTRPDLLSKCFSWGGRGVVQLYLGSQKWTTRILEP